MSRAATDSNRPLARWSADDMATMLHLLQLKRRLEATMNRRIGRLIQIALFAAMPAGAAFAQSPSSGMDQKPAPGDTRTPVQKEAGSVDHQVPALPSEGTKPGELPSHDINQGTPGSPMGDTSATPDSSKKSTGDTSDKKSAEPMAPPSDTNSGAKSDLKHSPDEGLTPKHDPDTGRDQLNSDK
jgi:hypothetical protein